NVTHTHTYTDNHTHAICLHILYRHITHMVHACTHICNTHTQTHTHTHTHIASCPSGLACCFASSAPITQSAEQDLGVDLVHGAPDVVGRVGGRPRVLVLLRVTGSGSGSGSSSRLSLLSQDPQ